MKRLRNIIDIFRTNEDVIIDKKEPENPEQKVFKKIENMVVGDLMLKRFIIFSPDAKVKEVLNAFNNKNIIEAVVVNGGKLVGIISHKDILKLIETVNLKYNVASDQQTFNKKLKSIGEYKLSSIVKDKVYTFPSISLFDAIIKMDENNIIALPVVDDNGYIVGILREQDIVKTFLEFLNKD